MPPRDIWDPNPVYQSQFFYNYCEFLFENVELEIVPSVLIDESEHDPRVPDDSYSEYEEYVDHYPSIDNDAAMLAAYREQVLLWLEEHFGGSTHSPDTQESDGSHSEDAGFVVSGDGTADCPYDLT